MVPLEHPEQDPENQVAPEGDDDLEEEDGRKDVVAVLISYVGGQGDIHHPGREVVPILRVPELSLERHEMKLGHDRVQDPDVLVVS